MEKAQTWTVKLQTNICLSRLFLKKLFCRGISFLPLADGKNWAVQNCKTSELKKQREIAANLSISFTLWRARFLADLTLFFCDVNRQQRIMGSGRNDLKAAGGRPGATADLWTSFPAFSSALSQNPTLATRSVLLTSKQTSSVLLMNRAVSCQRPRLMWRAELLRLRRSCGNGKISRLLCWWPI